MSVNSRLKATKIIDQRKAFYRQRIPESSCARKETVDKDILVISTNGDKKNHAIYQNNESTSLNKKEVEPVEPVLKDIYQSNTYRKDFSWQYFDDDPRVQETMQVKDKQSCLFVFVACLRFPNSN